jgi:hypothetical protein
MSLEPVLKKLQREKASGMIKKVDTQNYAVGVLFPKMKDILWFKTYELQRRK